MALIIFKASTSANVYDPTGPGGVLASTANPNAINLGPDVTPKPTIKPFLPSNGSCAANCQLSGEAVGTGSWSQFSLSTTVTAFTEVLIINNQTNTTSTSLITNTEVLGSFTVPTATNSLGTRTYQIPQTFSAINFTTTWTV